MFTSLKNKRGQGITQQYTVLFAIVAGVMLSMTVYVQRLIQARTYEARHFMHSIANEAYNVSSYNLQGSLLGSYEPYYKKETTAKAVDSSVIQSLIASGVGTPGIARSEYDQTISSEIIRNEALVNEAY